MRRLLPAVVAGTVLSCMALVATWFTMATTAGAAPAAPAYAGDFPDPFVLVDGTQYWAYATGSAGTNLQVVHSTDLRTWSRPADPLPVLPGWADPGHTWAPTVTPEGAGFLMYYTARDRASGRQCVSVASADRPAGPFRDTRATPLVCQLDRAGSIDPATITDNGTRYLLWKSEDNALGATTSLWSQPLSVDGRSLTGRPTKLLQQTARWQSPVIEGPSMVAVAGGFVLFYGASNWDSDHAAIGYATCASPLGPCRDASVSGPWLASRPGATGPSGPTTFTGLDGVARIAYHAWTGGVGYDNGGVRSLFIDRLSFTPAGHPRRS